MNEKELQEPIIYAGQASEATIEALISLGIIERREDGLHVKEANKAPESEW